MAPGTAALADVRAGVEAWSRGDHAAAVREWQGPAASGDADAQFNLAQAYKLGQGIPQDRARAEQLYAAAAAQGHLQASDMYGLILFDKGERQRALPYIRAAADRGDPRAQYLLGVAHFNGELVPKDWVRAYALVSLAVQGQVPQAQSALLQMDQYVPLEQRQQGIALSSELAAQADATRARQLAAVDLGTTVPTAASATPAAIRPTRPTPPSVATAEDAVTAAARVAGNDSPRIAGADYARPAGAGVTAAPRPAPAATPAPRPPQVAIAAPPRPAPTPAPQPAAASGPWRVQLGAFGVAANADAMWNRVRSRPELAGHPRLNVRAGAVTKLQAGGFATQQAAQAACGRLNGGGITCIAVRN